MRMVYLAICQQVGLEFSAPVFLHTPSPTTGYGQAGRVSLILRRLLGMS